MTPNKICETHRIQAEWKPGGVSKTTGKPYNGFYACPEKVNSQYCPGPIIDAPDQEKWLGDKVETSGGDRSHRIERQHSQEMAMRFLDICVRLDLIKAEEFNSSLVTKYTDHFQKDIDNSPKEGSV